jgi:hypothetical protein
MRQNERRVYNWYDINSRRNVLLAFFLIHDRHSKDLLGSENHGCGGGVFRIGIYINAALLERMIYILKLKKLFSTCNSYGDNVFRK